MSEFDINLREIKLRVYCEDYKKEYIKDLMTGHSFINEPIGNPTYKLVMYDNFVPKNYNLYIKMIDKWYDNATCDVWIDNKSKTVYMSNIEASQEKWYRMLVQYFTCNLFNRLLEEIGYIAFHSSCVEKDNTGLAFIAARNCGKTNCMLNLMNESFNSVTNDKIAIQFDGNQLNAYGVAQDVAIRLSKAFREQAQNQKYIIYAKEQNVHLNDINSLEGNKIHLYSTELAKLNGVKQIPTTVLKYIFLPNYNPNLYETKFIKMTEEELNKLLETQSLPLVHETTNFFNEIKSGNYPLYDIKRTLEEIKKLQAFRVIQGENTIDFPQKIKQLINKGWV